jgi:hypothetical protein
MGFAYFFEGKFDEAAAKLLLSIQFKDDPGFLTSYCAMVISGGLTKRAQSSPGFARSPPEIVPSDRPYCNTEHRELFLSGLRLAAGETGINQKKG